MAKGKRPNGVSNPYRKPAWADRVSRSRTSLGEGLGQWSRLSSDDKREMKYLYKKWTPTYKTVNGETRVFFNNSQDANPKGYTLNGAIRYVGTSRKRADTAYQLSRGGAFAYAYSDREASRTNKLAYTAKLLGAIQAEIQRKKY